MAKKVVRIVDRDHGWGRFFKLVDALKGGPHAKVGVLADSEKGGLHVPGAALTVAEIAAVNEFGTEDGHIPERSFVRRTFDEQQAALIQLSRAAVVQILLGNLSVGQALGLLGAKLAAEIKKRVTAGDHIPPPNAPSTVEAKGSDRPLVDTGRMINAVTWSIEMKPK